VFALLALLAAAGATDRVGAHFRECAECPEMLVLPAGEFTMGSAPTEESRSAQEGPQHPVMIPRPFALGVYDVTVGEYARFVRATGRPSGSDCLVFTGPRMTATPGRDWRTPGFVQDSRSPVVCVGWEDARDYARWLNTRLGRSAGAMRSDRSGPYRLPSEAEWEYAARGGTVGRYYWGDDALKACLHANLADLAGERAHPGLNAASCDDGFPEASPVGVFAPNPFGLYDMAGNVFQWIADCWHDSYLGAPLDGGAWMDGSCAEHVIRGGSFAHLPRLLRSAYRFKDPVEHRSIPLGFRLARTLEP
jgi:formylglycine-generating enzyme required for sulfatase activity